MNREQTITQFFAADHARIELLFTAFEKNVTDNFELAKQYFEALCNGLVRHMDWEEQVLLPKLKEHASDKIDESLLHLENDHVDLKGELFRIVEKLLANEPVEDDLEKLKDQVFYHHQMEERYFHPLVDEILDDEGTAEIFLRCFNNDLVGKPVMIP